MNGYEILIHNMTDDTEMSDVQHALAAAEISDASDGELGPYLMDHKPRSVFVDPSEVAEAVKVINGLGYTTDEDAQRLFYLDIRSRTFPNGFSSIESATIVETAETAPLDCFRKPATIDDITGYYFTRRDLAEIALKYHLDRNRDRGGIYGPASQIPASYAAGNRLAQHRAAFEALKNQ